MKKQLVILRGAPGSGKSTWIKENNLSDYTLSSDSFRLLLDAPYLGLDCEYHIPQHNDKKVWGMFYDVLEYRMKQGAFTIVDATNIRKNSLDKYIALAKVYQYEISVVDFDVALDVLKERNNSRSSLQRVPDIVIESMYQSMQETIKQRNIIYYTPEEFIKYLNRDGYNNICFLGIKITVIGDVHGCIDKLKELVEKESDSKLFIFLGDYIDRGPDSASVIKYIMELCEKYDVILLEGNHERHLRSYLKGEETRSDEFNNVTKPQLDKLPKSMIKEFVDKLEPKYSMNIFDSEGERFKRLYMCHGGYPKPFKNITDSNSDFILGVGTYGDEKILEDLWKLNSEDFEYMIYGHRNVGNVIPIRNGRTFNLNESPETGGKLRYLVIEKSTFREGEI